MRLAKFMKEDITTDALEIDEPEVGKKYSDDYIAKRVDVLQNALKKIRGKTMNDDAKEVIMADLNDKLDKWENVDKETKAPEPAPAAEPEEPEEDGEPEPEPEPEPDEEEAEEEPDDEEEKKVDREKEEEEKEKKRQKAAEEREKRQEKAATESVRLIKTKIKRQVK